jgi:anti-anti-sigma regulatory factor
VAAGRRAPRAAHRETRSLAIECVDDVTIVHLVGEHDVGSAGMVRAAIERAVVDGNGVALSFTRATIDASLIDTFVAGGKLLLQQGRRLVLCIETGSAADLVPEPGRPGETFVVADTVGAAIVLAQQCGDQTSDT